MDTAAEQSQDPPALSSDGEPQCTSAVQQNLPEAKKPYGQILKEEIGEGLHELKRPQLGLFLSGFSAGLDIGFSLFLMAVMKTLIGKSQIPPVVNELMVASMYSVGFIFVVLGRSELFTEHTTLAVLPLLDGQSTLGRLTRLWVIVYFSNLLGTAVFAYAAVLIGPRLHVIEPATLGEIARQGFEGTGLTIMLGAVLAGWLMGLLSWLVTAARDTISQIFIVLLITSSIGLCHLNHTVVGSVEVLAGLFSGQHVIFANFMHFLTWTTLGNAIGGIVFVAVLKYSHASRGEETQSNESYSGAGNARIRG